MQIQVIPHEADPHRVRGAYGSLELLGDTEELIAPFRVARLKLSRRGLLLQPDCRRHRSNLIADQRGEDRVLGKISIEWQIIRFPLDAYFGLETTDLGHSSIAHEASERHYRRRSACRPESEVLDHFSNIERFWRADQRLSKK